MVFAGAVTELNFKSRLLFKIGRVFNNVLPYYGFVQNFRKSDDAKEKS